MVVLLFPELPSMGREDILKTVSSSVLTECQPNPLKSILSISLAQRGKRVIPAEHFSVLLECCTVFYKIALRDWGTYVPVGARIEHGSPYSGAAKIALPT